MPTFNEVNHIRGPAIVTFDSQVWYSDGDIDVDIQQATWDVSTSRFGIIDKRVKSLPVAKVSFKPSGMLTSGLAAKAFPYTLASVGQSIFGATDKPLTIQTLAGQLYTFGKAAVTGSPALYLGADKCVFDGTLQFMCINKTSVDPTTADAFLDITATAFADVSFDETKVISPGFSAAYGLTPYDVMESLDGFRIELPIQTAEQSVNRFGVIGAMLTSIGPATCKFTPAGMTEANWISLVNLDGANVRLPGASSASGATNLVISGTGLTVTLTKAGCVSSRIGFGAAKERLGELTFFNRAVFTAGVPGSLLTIAVS
jgi:hypothetical protein